MKKPRTLADRIRERLADLGLDAANTSVKAELSRSGIRNILEGKSVSPRGKTIAGLARVLKTTTEWLNEERGPKEAPEADPNEIKLAPVEGPTPFSMTQDVPVYGTAAGAALEEFQGFSLEGEVIEYVRRPPSLRGVKEVYAFYVVEDSMYPQDKAGDLRFAHAKRPPRPGDTIIIQTRDGEHADLKSFIKVMVRKKLDGTIVAKQFNPACEMEFRPDIIEAVHRVLTMNDLFGI